MVSVTPRPLFTPGTYWIGGWVGLRADLNTEAREEITKLWTVRPVLWGGLFYMREIFILKEM
jgi:hypothetical protein